MHVTARLRNPLYYTITAQLQGSGAVTCRIEVNGKTIARSQATGGYNIATCQIGKGLLSGKWQAEQG